MSEHKKILLIIPGGISYTHRVGVGISSKVNQYESWIVHVTPLAQADFMQEFSPDGIIMNISTEVSLEFAESLNAHVVNYSGVRDVYTMPTVRLDDCRIGEMAADYFLSLGLKNFALFGHKQTSFAKLRCESFSQHLSESGIDNSNIHFIEVQQHHFYHSNYDRYAEILRQLPKPIGIFVQDDRCGCYLSNVARSAGLAVPGEIAILGVDDDEMYCNLAKPTLSSIATPAYQVGAIAVDLLAALLEGKDVPNEAILLPPLGVVARGTTEMLAIDDSELTDAIRFIRSHPAEAITVEDVLAEVPVSRSSLERKFQRHFGRSPGEEIRRVKIEYVKNLLLNTNMTISEIARKCNYRDVQYLSSSFKRITAKTPSEFRCELSRGR